MIKNFETYIKEGRMGRLVNADETSVRKQDELTEEEVRSYLHPNLKSYCKKVVIRYEGNKPIVDVEGDFVFRKDITEIPFQFGEVSGYFDCSFCKNLTSLEGCPKETGGGFSCESCPNLTSLECCPQKVGDHFSCSNCQKLTSIEGCPKEVGEDFFGRNCGKKFTEQEVRSLCNIKGEISL